MSAIINSKFVPSSTGKNKGLVINSIYESQPIIMNKTITINGQDVKIKQVGQEDYFCITDIAKSGDGKPSVIVRNYLRNRNTIAFLGFWEQLHNENFNGVGFDTIDRKTGLNSLFNSLGL